MQKVQSGIAGELEPLRRLGYALDKATLQQIALNNGITQNIDSMTQAQRSQLRYIAILQQSSNVMGDMARTVVSPANAMRIMKQQLAQFERALGNIISIFATKLIPYVQAGFDEITILPFKEDESGSGSDTGNQFDLGIDLPEYDFLKGLTGNDYDEIYERMRSKVYDLIDAFMLLTDIRDDFKYWRDTGDWYPLLTDLNKFVEKTFGKRWTKLWNDLGEAMYDGINNGDWYPLFEASDSIVRCSDGRRRVLLHAVFAFCKFGEREGAGRHRCGRQALCLRRAFCP